MPGEEHFRRLERMYASAPINAFFRPSLKISLGRAEVIIPVRPDLLHAAGAVHGAVYFKAMDDATFFAVASLIEDVFPVTVTFTTYLTRPISEGELRAVGEVVHQSKRLFIAEAQLFDSHGRQIGRGSGTFMKSSIPLSPEIGYR
jgi:uncharacterized protein (TIGR00369 family)